MITEIDYVKYTVINYDKYTVIKNDDTKYLTLTQLGMLNSVLEKIKRCRKEDGKKENLYLVLNIEDTFDVQYLWSKLTDVSINTSIIKIKDIAVNLVNAILKVKYEML